MIGDAVAVCKMAGSSGAGAGSFVDGEVANFSALPAAAANAGRVYLVLAAEGVFLLTRKRAGLYRSDGAAWTRLGDVLTLFNDANFELYNNADNTKKAVFSIASVTTGTERTITVPDLSGTIALLEAGNVFTQLQTINATLDMNENNIINVDEIIGGDAITDELILRSTSAVMVDPDVDGMIRIKNPVMIDIPSLTGTDDAYYQSIAVIQDIDCTGQSIVTPIGFYFKPVIKIDTAQSLGIGAAFWEQSTWQEESAITGSHTDFSVTGFATIPRYSLNHAGTAKPPSQVVGYNSEPGARNPGAGTLTLPEICGFSTNRPLTLRGFIGLAQLSGTMTITEYNHYVAYSDVTGGLVLAGAAAITTEIGLNLKTLDQGTTNITLKSDADVAYMDHAGDIRINSDTRGLVLGAGQDSKLYFDGSNLIIDSLASGEIIFNEAGADVDFRVEASGHANALFVQGSDGYIGVNGTPADLLNLFTATTEGITLTRSGSSAIGRFYDDGNNLGIEVLNANSLTIDTNSTERMRITNGGLVCINDSVNTNMTLGLTINQGGADNEILAFKSSDVAHGLVTISETDTYAMFEKQAAGGGGLRINAITDGGEGVSVAMLYRAYLRDTADTTTTAAARGIIEYQAAQHDGADSISSVAADGNLFTVKNNTSAAFIVKGDGDIYYDGADQGAYDSFDDMALIQEARFMGQWDKKILNQNRVQLQKLGIVTEGGFISNRKMTALQLGAMTQMFDYIKKLEERIEELEAA